VITNLENIFFTVYKHPVGFNQ